MNFLQKQITGCLTMVVVSIGVAAMARAGGPLPPLETVHTVDLTRYAGQWYEIARYPNRFQKDCRESSARYSLRADGEVDVLNQCTDAISGKLRQANGRAWPTDSSNARLKVSFFWPFRGDYWIMELGKEYEYAVIGTPDRNYFWILSREPAMDQTLYQDILQRARKQGFDPAQVVRQTKTGMR